MLPRPSSFRVRFALALSLVAPLVACGGEVTARTDNRLPPPGTLQAAAGPSFAINPATGLPFVVEANAAGNAASIKILDVVWGRLADVYDRDPATGARRLRFEDLLIGDDIASDAVDFELVQRPVTLANELTVLHAFGSPGFAAAFTRLEANLHPLLIKSFAPNELPPFTAVPRNAALAIRCDDLLEDGGSPGFIGYPGTIRASNVHVVAGYPPQPFEARVLPDPNHGDLVGQRFHSTRILVDLAVSPIESQATGVPINMLGFPAATTTAIANAGVRIPTVIHHGAQQFDIVRNLSGAGLSFTGNGATDPASPTLDVVRAFRSGGKTQVTGDPHNGFLADTVQPQVMAVVDCFLSYVAPTGVPGEFRAVVRFPDPDCESRLVIGSLIESGPNVAEIVQVGATGAKLRLLSGDPLHFYPGQALFATPWVPWLALRPACAVRIDPAGDGPNKLVSTGATIAVTFSEPIDPTSVQPFDTLTVKPATSTSPLSQFVIGHIVLTSDATQFRFVPELPLHHETNVMERYLVDVVAGASGITDLAGNPLLLQLPQTDFTLDKAQPSALTSGIALRFASTDEDGDGKRELRGQFLFDLAQQQIVPRPVTRFSGAADASAPVVGAMIPLLQPVQTPLSPYGSKLHAVWRYHDVGLGLLDEATHNLDVEGMSWSPFAGAPVADHFTRFQMSFAHSKFLPDEEVGTSLLPNWPSSGLVTKFADNNYDVADPPAVVHAASKGYTVDPADVFTSPAGLPMTHWPLNRGVPLGQYSYWTWRDTAKIAVGGPNGHGADTQRLQQITKVANTNFYIAGRVPTIGLPLLTEFRTYPEFAANGTNGLRIAIALNSSASPYFRVFSTGGVTVGGQIINVDPDNTPVAMGAVNPSTGLFTAPRDNVFHYGEAEFVVRVSRAHTVWFDTASPSSFATPVVIAGTTAVPSGTQIQLAFRGASSITGSATPPAWRDAENYDAYGDGYNTLQLFSLGKPGNLAFTPSFFNNPPNTTDNSWKSSIAALDGARYVQARISFLSNAETSATTSLSSLGIAYQH